MTGHFEIADRETDFLLPSSIQDWLPEDHLARFVVEVVDQIDLSDLTRQYAGRGSRAHHPSVLLSLLICGYASARALRTETGRMPNKNWPNGKPRGTPEKPPGTGSLNR